MTHELLKYFRIEATELIEQIGKGVLDIEKNGTEPELVSRVLRAAHTLKGTSRVVKEIRMAELAHAIEEQLGPFREKKAQLDRETADLLLELVDALSRSLAQLGAAAPTAPAAPESAAEQRASLEPGTDRARGTPSLEESTRTVPADLDDIDALLEGVAEAHGQLGGMRRTAAAFDQMLRLNDLVASRLRAPKTQRRTEESDVWALSLVEELRAVTSSLARTLHSAFDRADRELEQVRELAERVRLVPAGLMFTSLERAARDVATNLGLSVELETKGADVRLDSDVLRVVQPALLQMVRNAVAHGIEPASDRIAAGKHREGRVEVAVQRRRGKISFLCRDDGRGVDVEAIRRTAQRRGLTWSDGQRFGPEELVKSLLKGGVSTASTVTQMSGRGIGFDIVRDAAARMRAEVEVHTEPGRGTTIELVAPVTLASVDALWVEAGGQSAAIPLAAIKCVLRIGAGGVARGPKGRAIAFEGALIPFVSLVRWLRKSAETPKHERTLVILEHGGVRAAIGVDKIIGKSNLIQRPVPELTPADPLVAGVSLDAEGNPQLVLDAEVLVREAVGLEAPFEETSARAKTILVIDDSLTTRMLEQSILESAGYQVDVASSGEEGLEKARLREYALFLVDVEMPGMDGFTFIAQTRAEPKLSVVPAILVTSRSSPEDKRRGEDVGASAYIVKNEFNQSDLLSRILKIAR